jgi:hypothetical protein
MLKAALKVLKYAGLALVIVIAMGAVLFAFGLRVVLDGGGSPHLRFVKSADAQADELARHREAQRAQPPTRGTLSFREFNAGRHPEARSAHTGSGDEHAARLDVLD